MAMTLVDAAKQGDDLAFDGLLEPLLEPGYRLACAMLHEHEAAEDAHREPRRARPTRRHRRIHV